MIRRAIILPGVLVVVSIAAIIGVAAISRTNAHEDLADAALGSMQSRSLAWSGVLAVQSQLQSSRLSILAGEDPSVQLSWSTSISGGIGVVRLLPFTEEGDEAPIYVEFESAKLDLNMISVDSLAQLDGIGPELAGRIVGARGVGFQCVEAIAKIEGVTDEVLFGPMRESESPTTRRGLLESLTTFAFDPNTTVQFEAVSSSDHDSAKISVSTQWSESFAEEVRERCGESIAQACSRICGGQIAISRESDLLKAMKAQGVPQSAWGIILNTFSVSDDLFRIGKTDINRASPHVLALLPGLDEESANRLVATRSSLSGMKKLDLAWPLVSGAVDEEQYLQLVDFISTRTAQFRIRVEAGVRRNVSEDVTETDGQSQSLERAVVLEAVIDIAGAVPRVAYLREITLLQTARRLAREVQLREDDGDAGVASGENSQVDDVQAVSDSMTSAPENDPDLEDQSAGEADDVPEASSVSSTDRQSSSPPKWMDRRLGRWKNPGRS